MAYVENRVTPADFLTNYGVVHTPVEAVGGQEESPRSHEDIVYVGFLYVDRGTARPSTPRFEGRKSSAVTHRDDLVLTTND